MQNCVNDGGKKMAVLIIFLISDDDIPKIGKEMLAFPGTTCESEAGRTPTRKILGNFGTSISTTGLFFLLENNGFSSQFHFVI